MLYDFYKNGLYRSTQYFETESGAKRYAEELGLIFKENQERNYR